MAVKKYSKKHLLEIKKLVKGSLSREDFVKNFPKEYDGLKRRGLAGKMLKHFPYKKKSNWNYRLVKKEALKYKTRSDFSLKSSNAYCWAIKHKKINQVCSHMKRVNLVYDDNFLLWLEKEIYKLKTRSAFCIKYPKLFESLIGSKNKKIIILLKKLKRNRFVTTSIGEESLRSFLNKVFKTRFIKVRPKKLINPKTGRKLELDGFCKKTKIAFEHDSKLHNNKSRDKVKDDFCKKNGIKLIRTPDLFNESKRKTINDIKFIVYDLIRAAGIKISKKRLLSTKFVWKIGKSQKWTLQSLKKVVKKYKILKFFIREQKGAYIAIKRQNLNFLLKNMKKRVVKSKYEDKFLLKEALKYTNLNQFRNGNVKLYSSFRKRKHLIKIFYYHKPKS